MKPQINKGFIRAFLLALVAISNFSHAATITWTNTAGGNWSGPKNWNPNQVPTNADNVLITTPGTYTVTLDVINSGIGTNANSLILGAGGGSGLQTFLMPNLSSGSLLIVNSLVLVTNGGMLLVTNGSMLANNVQIDQGGIFNGSGETVEKINLIQGTSLIVANGGVLNSVKGTIIESAIVVTNGGVINANNDTFGAVVVAQGGNMNVVDGYFNQGLMVTPGGVVNFLPSESVQTSPHVYSSVFDPIVNSGTITATNATLNFYNVGLSNLPAGVIKLQGSSTVGVNDSGTLVNQGSLVESSGPGSTTMNLGTFDNTLGTVTNLAGTLVLGTFQTNLAGIYYAAAGATIQFNAINDGTNFVTPGTPLVLAGSGQYQVVSGDLYYSSNAISNLTLLGTTLKLGSGFQGGAITNLSLNGIALSNTLPVTGQLSATNSAISGNFTIANGGVFTGSNFTTYGNIAVALGGVFNANGGTEAIRGSLAVANGGVLNVGGQFTLFAPLTNNGTINLSNAPINLFGTGIINQSGGIVNFRGNGSGIFWTDSGTEYFINQGSVFENSPGGTNTINLLQNLNLAQGTVTNLAGTLILENFQTNLAGTFLAAAGATIQLIGGTAASPLAPGTPLVFAGGGQNQFKAGCLFLPTNTIPGLGLLGGTLELGANFQGGAITNLAVSGMTLTNSIPINGTFLATNYSQLYGNFTVASGGVFDCYGANIFGYLTVANGGLITVAGEGGYTYPSSAVLIAAGATMNITGSIISLNGPLTNAGTINITYAPSLFIPFPYSGISSYNDGLGIHLGGVLNQASGLINLASDAAEVGNQSGGYEYLINQGRIAKTAGTNYSFVEAPLATNSGTITAESGKIVIYPLVTKTGGTLNVVLNSATNYGAFLVYSPSYPTTVATNMVFGGAFNATLSTGYVPANGSSFNVFSLLSPDSYTGSFSSLGLPAGVTWQSNYGATNFTLVAGNGQPVFAAFSLSGTNLIFSGTGGTAGSNYVILASTNLALPLINWTALTTNQFDGSGQLRFTNPISPAKPRQFFIFKSP
jgi:hypothetical protein